MVSKYGMAKNLKTLAVREGIDPDRFYPRCFDLGDLQDFEDFIENFKFTFAETVLKRFLYDPNRYRKFETKVRVALAVLAKRRASLLAQIESAVPPSPVLQPVPLHHHRGVEHPHLKP
jgi:tubulin monoglycylase TTLL3/8